MVPITVRIPIEGGIWGEEEVVINNDELFNNMKSVAWPVREFNIFESRGHREFF